MSGEYAALAARAVYAAERGGIELVKLSGRDAPNVIDMETRRAERSRQAFDFLRVSQFNNVTPQP